jgi:hypothetical protein
MRLPSPPLDSISIMLGWIDVQASKYLPVNDELSID